MTYDNPEWLLGDNSLLRVALAKAGAFKVQDDEYFEPDYTSINTDMTAVDQLQMEIQHKVEKFLEGDARVPLHIGKKLIRPSNRALFWNFITRRGEEIRQRGLLRNPIGGRY